MKYTVLIIMTLAIAILGCSPTPKAGMADGSAQQEPELGNTAPIDYEKGSWIENWDWALDAAKKMERPILINFTGSDWCPWCFRLRDEVFAMDEFQAYAKDNLVLLTVDFPRKLQQSDELKSQNQILQRQFGIQGYPTILLVDKDGKEIARSGYQAGGAAKYVEHIKELLAK